MDARRWTLEKLDLLARGGVWFKCSLETEPRFALGACGGDDQIVRRITCVPDLQTNCMIGKLSVLVSWRRELA